MNALARTVGRIPAVARAVLALSLGWALSVGVLDHQTVWIRRWLLGHGWLDAENAFQNLEWVFRQSALDPLLFLASGLVPAALLVRLIGRARVRAGLPDPLDQVRDWTATHGKLTRAALALPAIAWFVNPTRHVVHSLLYGYGVNMRPAADVFARLQMPFYTYFEAFIGVMAVTAFGVYAGMRGGLRAFLAPTVGPGTGVPQPDERVGFDAVAVTTETRVAVGTMGALALVMAIGMLSSGPGSTAAPVALAVYAAVAVGGVLAFRRKSRVVIGVDGVFVTGTSRSRFLAYRDLDAVRVRGTDIQLVRGDRVVLRLQLHGEDATHKDAIVARIAEAIQAAQKRETSAVGEIVGATSEGQLAQLASGGGGYRAPSVTREQLWSVVEGPEHDAEKRTAAARALAGSGDRDEKQRTRLRVAAARSAEPRVRVALETLAEDEDDMSVDPLAMAVPIPRA